jgi:hypothetical protein
MVWRQLNIRKCRLGSNLFKDTISPFASMVVPRWVKEKIKINPREKFWQYHFREKETKTAHEVRSVLPRRLVPLLEEFLEQHRPILLQGPDPGTLFMNKKNGPLTAGEVGSLVGELTLKYGKKRVTPHRFRDAFAYWWLDQHPEDYLTVSKKLWHRNIQTTIRNYGCKFDEAQADCRVEADHHLSPSHLVPARIQRVLFSCSLLPVYLCIFRCKLFPFPISAPQRLLSGCFEEALASEHPNHECVMSLGGPFLGAENEADRRVLAGFHPVLAGVV